MISRIRTAILFALYQTSIAAGIVLLPLAVALERIGLTLPLHRVLRSIDEALESASPNGTR